MKVTVAKTEVRRKVNLTVLSLHYHWPSTVINVYVYICIQMHFGQCDQSVSPCRAI